MLNGSESKLKVSGPYISQETPSSVKEGLPTSETGKNLFKEYNTSLLLQTISLILLDLIFRNAHICNDIAIVRDGHEYYTRGY